LQIFYLSRYRQFIQKTYNNPQCLFITHTGLSTVGCYLFSELSGVDNGCIDVLRVVRHGLDVKAAVDSAIDQCAQFFNLRDSIEDAALRAEEAMDDQQRRRHIERGSHDV
jgi:hypothetical protein